MTVRRAALLGFAVLLAACGGAAISTEPVAPQGEAVEVSSLPVDLRSSDPADRRLGRLVYRGGVSVVPRDDRFGGLSAFRVSPDGARFVAVEDLGLWATGALDYDAAGNLAGLGDVRIARILGADGAPLEGKSLGDSEGLAFAEPRGLGGDAFVSFERDHRVLRFAFAADGTAAKGEPFAMPEAIRALRENEGLEVLVTLADGRLLAISEYGPRDDDQDSTGWVVDPATGASLSFTVKRNLPHAMTGAALLPDGRVLTVERRFDVLTGPGAQLRIFDPADFQDGATVDGELVATLFGGVTVDNMEGIAVRRDAEGRTLVYLVSDDNFQRPLQRTLVMMFELTE